MLVNMFLVHKIRNRTFEARMEELLAVHRQKEKDARKHEVLIGNKKIATSGQQKEDVPKETHAE